MRYGLGAQPNQGGINAAPTDAPVGVALMRPCRIDAILGLGAERDQGGINAAPTDAPVGVALMRPWRTAGSVPTL